MNKRNKKFEERIKVNVKAYPFDADEMLMKTEFRNKGLERNKTTRILGDNPFDAEEMLLNAELRKMKEGR